MQALQQRAHLGLVLAVFYAALLALLYRGALPYLVSQWGKEDFNYCYLMPFVIAYLFWQRRERLHSLPQTPSWAGLVPLCLGIALFWLGELGGEFYTLDLSLWFSIVGLVWLHQGWPRLRASAFPLLLILTVFPPPNFLYTKISLHLRLLSSALGVWLIQAFGGSAYRQGNVIDLGFTQLQVVDACSGLRYVFPLLVLALLIAYFSRMPLWRRALLVASAVPLAIVVNAGRIAVTAFLTEAWGPKAAEGLFHDFSGWLIFIVSFAVLAGEAALLGRVRTEDRGPRTGPRASGLAPRVSRLAPRALVSSVLLLATLALSSAVDFRERVPIRKPLAGLPTEIGAWVGSHQKMEQRFIDALDFNDYTMADYQNPEGRVVSLYVAYYETQRKGEAIHSPETCLPGSGWVFRQSGAAEVSAPGRPGRAIRVNRAFMENAGQRELVYFWFPQRGRVLTTLPQLKLYTFWDALTKRRTDGALVRLITPVYETEELSSAEQRLAEFTGLVVPVLDGFLPGDEAGR